MFSFLKKLSPQRNEAPDSTPAETDPERMTLDERMAYRREMLYQSIRESLLQLQVVSSMYKFRVMNLDARHHRFVAMIEVTNSFEAKMGGISVGFSQIEEFIRKRAFERHGISLEAIFWRVNETESSFVRTRRTGDSPNAAPPDTNPARQREVPGDAAGAGQRLARAIKDDSQLAGVSVEHLDYQSEHAPLQASEPSGKTEYGQL